MPSLPLATLSCWPAPYQSNGRADPAVVHHGRRRSEERSAAGCITGVARTIFAALAPVFSDSLCPPGADDAPFFIAGALKVPL